MPTKKKTQFIEKKNICFKFLIRFRNTDQKRVKTLLSVTMQCSWMYTESISTIQLNDASAAVKKKEKKRFVNVSIARVLLQLHIVWIHWTHSFSICQTIWWSIFGREIFISVVFGNNKFLSLRFRDCFLLIYQWWHLYLILLNTCINCAWSHANKISNHFFSIRLWH